MHQLAIQKRTVAGLLIAALSLLISGSGTPVQEAPRQPGVADSTNSDPAAFLPNGPEKALVLEHCMACHDLDWIAQSGGSKEGWERRLVRMIRAGATIPRDKIPAVAAYLAKALPERPLPQAPAQP
jgi:cytochrome c5